LLLSVPESDPGNVWLAELASGKTSSRPILIQVLLIQVLLIQDCVSERLDWPLCFSAKLN
jgi:hypothetical protein